jgi:hypothetical protein
MATGGEVLQLLCLNVEYTIWGDDYDGIDWYGKLPAITKEQFETGFAQVETAKAQAEAEAAAKKAAAEAKLAALGLTADDLKALGLGGN